MSESEATPVFIRGKRVNLRPITKADAVRYVQWMNDPEVRQFLANYMPMNLAEEEGWIENLADRKPHDIVLAIDTIDGAHIGSMGLHRIDLINRVAWTGAVIGDSEYWGKGYGTEAKMLLLYYAFMDLNLRKICSSVFEFNGRSQAYLRKTGYVVEGCLKAQRYRDGQYWDEILMAVFKEDWLPLWKEYSQEYLPLKG